MLAGMGDDLIYQCGWSCLLVITWLFTPGAVCCLVPTQASLLIPRVCKYVALIFVLFL